MRRRFFRREAQAPALAGTLMLLTAAVVAMRLIALGLAWWGFWEFPHFEPWVSRALAVMAALLWFASFGARSTAVRPAGRQEAR